MGSVKSITTWLLSATVVVLLFGSVYAWACDPAYDPSATYSYCWTPQNRVDEDIWVGDHKYGHRVIQCSQGHVYVDVIAYAVPDGQGWGIDHEEYAYGHAEANCTISFVLGSLYNPKPKGMYVKGYCTSTGTYHLRAYDYDMDFDCWVAFLAHAIGSTHAPEPVHLTNDDPQPAKNGTQNLSTTDTSWYQRAENQQFEAARISATAHAHQRIHSVGGSCRAYGDNSVTGWGVSSWYPYW